jgi:hypothetical protein
MLSYTDFLVRHEHYRDLLQKAEHERVIQAIGLRHPGDWRLHWKVADWVGAQMIKWGCELQRYATAPPPRCRQVAECQ